MDGFDKSLEEASMDLGESIFGTFWRVTFPLLLPGIIASLLLSFVISFDEFILAFFLSSSDQTLPIYMWSQLRFPKKLPHVLALGAIIIVATSFIVMLSYWFRNLGQSNNNRGSHI
jgi:spermidine/putrescine transport system permease protein